MWRRAVSFGVVQPSGSVHGAKAFTWPNEPPNDIPFGRSDLFTEAGSRIHDSGTLQLWGCRAVS